VEPGGAVEVGTRVRAVPFAIAMLVLAVVAVVVPALAADHYHALGIPRGDDWSYLRTLFRWVDTGDLDFNNWVSMTLLGQLAVAAPIAMIGDNAIGPLQLFTALLGLAGLVAVVLMGLSLGRRLWIAAAVAVLVALTPSWGALAIGFMTDIPAFGASMLCMMFGMRALARRPVSMPLLATSMCFGFWGFTIREYAVIPLIAVVLVAAWTLVFQHDERRFGTLALLTAGVVVAAIVFMAFWHTVPSPKSFGLHFPDGHAIKTLAYKGTGLLRLLGLILLPVLLLVGPMRLARRAWATSSDTTVFAALFTAVGLAFTGTQSPRIGFGGNYVVPDGILGHDVIVGNRADLFPTGVFNTLLIVGTIGAVLLVLAALPWAVELAARCRALEFTPRNPVRSLPALALVGYAAAYGLAATLGLPLYDRYLLPMIPLAALLLLRGGPAADETADPDVLAATKGRTAGAAVGLRAARLVPAALVFALFGVIAFVYTIDSASFDGTRWRVARAATAEGWNPRQINGGFEWINYYSDSPGYRAARSRKQACVQVVVDPPASMRGKREIVASRRYTPPFTDPVDVVAFRTPKECEHPGEQP
jgi:hypothetical protein